MRRGLICGNFVVANQRCQSARGGRELLAGVVQRQRCPRRQQQPGRSCLCFPIASCAGLCESAFLQSENETAGKGGRLSGRREPGGEEDGGGDLVKKGAACEMRVVS